MIGCRALVIAGLLVLGACSGEDRPGGDATAEAIESVEAGPVDTESGGEPAVSPEASRYPDILAVEQQFADGTWTFDVTVSSPYDSPARYADGWRVMGPDGTELGMHTLTHDHAGEQPFTRTQSGVEIPPDVDEVTFEGRDSENGFGGGSRTVTLERP